MKIIFSSNISWSIFNFRSDLLKELQKDGHTIYAVAKKDKYTTKLLSQGFKFYQIEINNNNTNPLRI